MTERERLAAVRRYDILEPLPDAELDRATALLARLLRAPIALISIVDHDRICFKSHHGLDVEQIEREPGLCASCVMQGEPWIVSDARQDVRSSANPMVIDMGVQSYWGFPLRTHDGFNIGTLSVLDVVPRTPSAADIRTLRDLAALVMDELELKRLARGVAASHDAELARRELREDKIKGLTRELAHRTKNILAVVQAIARQTTPQNSASDLSGRIASLGYTHDLVADAEWQGTHLHNLVARQLAHFEPVEPPRIVLSGPALKISPVAAQHLGLALHELGLNAVRHGSLSRREGKVLIHWRLHRERQGHWAELNWEETGGPAVSPVHVEGFGRLVLERLTPQGLGATAMLAFRPTGVVWSCGISAMRIAPR